MNPRQRSVSATDVLPADLIAEIQKHAEGVFIYVPAVSPSARPARDVAIVEARMAGKRVRDIAADFGMTERRVSQILSRERRESGGGT